jgi:protein O-GlcNAc transferase
MRLITIQHLLCAWDGLEQLYATVRSSTLCCPDQAPNPFFFLTIPSTASEQLACAQSWAALKYSAHQQMGRARSSFVRTVPRDRLYIGYFSADFHSHATSHLIVELFELHNRHHVAISAYSTGPDDRSDIRRRVIGAVDSFVDLAGVSVQLAANRIHEDGIDILVDVKG